MKKEFWKPIKDFEYYFISNFGRVKSTKFGKERILKPIIVGCGYLFVNLCKNGKVKKFLVHRLVVEAFLEIPEELKHLKGTCYLQVNHKDENKSNNNVENLEWCTSSYNVNYGSRTEKCSKKNTNGKLSKKVYQYTLDGEFVREWESTRECDRNGFNHGAVAACCRGELKKYKDSIWRYK